jgi:hypothetical protein
MLNMDKQFVSIGEIVIDTASAPLIVQAARPIPAAAIAMLKYQLAYLLDTRFKPAPPEPAGEMTAEEVRALWGCHHVTILRRIRAGALHPIEHNGNLFFRREEVERLKAEFPQSRVGAPPPREVVAQSWSTSEKAVRREWRSRIIHVALSRLVGHELTVGRQLEAA